jgi:urease accessory protein
MSVIIEERLAGPQAERPSLELTLPFEQRQKSRLLARLSSGEEAALFLPRGTVLRGGDLLRAKDGRIVSVVAQDERVLQVTCADAQAIARAAYHLGNRHVPLQVGKGWLRLEADHVLKDMLIGLGAQVEEIKAPFEPESGAYGGHAGSDGHHQHGSSNAKIHDHYHPPQQQPHSHSHPHDHPHDHPHGHSHDQ